MRVALPSRLQAVPNWLLVLGLAIVVGLAGVAVLGALGVSEGGRWLFVIAEALAVFIAFSGMRAYIIRRLVEIVLLSVVLSFLIFVIINIIPGAGPLATAGFENPRATAADLKRLEQQYGLNDPIPVRYLRWLGGVVQGDWGKSWKVSGGEKVTTLIGSRLGNTLWLTITSTLISLVIALVAGIVAAVKQYSFLDYGLTFFSYFAISMPTFWFGLMLIIIFAGNLHWFPTNGVYSPEYSADTVPLTDRLWHLALPVTVLALFNVANWSRFIRSAMLEVMRQDYLRTARAKGVLERLVISKHALRNALIPVITLIGLDLPNLFAGAIVTETIFSYSGMGRLFIQSINEGDWPVVQAILVISAGLVLVSNLIADLLYAAVDPRIRY